MGRGVLLAQRNLEGLKKPVPLILRNNESCAHATVNHLNYLIQNKQEHPLRSFNLFGGERLDSNINDSAQNFLSLQIYALPLNTIQTRQPIK